MDCIEYLGCYKDTPHRALSEYSGNGKTKDSCYADAKKAGKKYFGLQNSSGDFFHKQTSECWYGDEPYDKHGIADNCVIGGDGYNVGGAWSNAIYRING